MEQVHLSVCMSLDGHIDALGCRPLVLSSEEDCHDMHALRAECDAILVGAATARRDQPRLTVRYEELLHRRRERGLPDHPLKVVVTHTGALDPASGFFTCGGDRVVLCNEHVLADTRDRLGRVATVMGLDHGSGAPGILARLSTLGVRRLLVEGGSQILTQFLAAGAFHHLRMAIAPFLVGQEAAPRLAGPGLFPHGPDNRLEIRSTRLLGNICVIDMHNPAPRL
ncbi:RibD family protein [Niveispirillum fermenti]|uniref:RibD family protein n=1 Tax=Niveispirillum fermenti TaxID=1233113 RepID=UPI003A8604F0